MAAGAEVWRDTGGAVFAYCRAEAGQYWMDLPGLATFCFDGDGNQVAASPSPGVAPDTVVEAYWHSALPLVLQARGAEVLHASAVRTPRGVAAFCGASGSGKSTIAYGLHRRGYGLWADDAVALDMSQAGIGAVPLAFDVRLRPASAAFFGLGAEAARLTGAGDSGGRVGWAPVPLVAVCVIDRGSRAFGDAALTRLRPSTAFPAVLAHAFCFSLQDLGRKRLMLDRYLGLVARVPVFELGFGEGLAGLAAVLDAIERAIGAGD